MHRWILPTLFATFASAALHAAPTLEEVVVYECTRLASPPLIDGVLDDEAWEDVVEAEVPYKFAAMTPVPARSRSVFKIGYDDVGLYLGAVFFRTSDAPLKRHYLGHDDPKLWEDDSTEIYFSPSRDGRFFKFIVSNAGVVTDMRMAGEQEGLDYSYDAVNADIRTRVRDEAWVLEMAVPWRDFDLEGPPGGAPWTFELLRFTGEHEEWGSWTVGGQFYRPERFGFISFQGGAAEHLSRLAEAVAGVKGDRWRMLTPDGVLTYNSWSVAADLALGAAARQLTLARLNARSLGSDGDRDRLLSSLDPLQKKYDRVSAAAAEGLASKAALAQLLHDLSEVEERARELRFEARMAEAVSQLSGKGGS